MKYYQLLALFNSLHGYLKGQQHLNTDMQNAPRPIVQERNTLSSNYTN